MPQLFDYIVQCGVSPDTQPVRWQRPRRDSSLILGAVCNLAVFESAEDAFSHGFEPITRTPLGTSASLNLGCWTGGDLFLGVQRSPLPARAVTDIKIIYTDRGETCPRGYELADGNCNKGTIGRTIRICLARQAASHAVSPVVDVAIVNSSTDDDSAFDFVTVKKSLTAGSPGGRPVFLSFRRAAQTPLTQQRSFTPSLLSFLDASALLECAAKEASSSDNANENKRETTKAKTMTSASTRNGLRAVPEFVRQVPLFCFPSGAQSSTQMRLPEYVTFTLTSESGRHLFGHAFVIWRMHGDRVQFVPQAVCLLRWDHPLRVDYEALLCHAYRLVLSPNRLFPLERLFAAAAVASRRSRNLPLTFASVSLSERFDIPADVGASFGLLLPPLLRRHCDVDCVDDDAQEYEDVLAVLSTADLCRMFLLLLLEQRVLVLAQDVRRLTPLLTGLAGLLWPLRWAHTFIPLLPEFAHCVTQSPVPFLVGAHATLADEIQLSDEVFVLRVWESAASDQTTVRSGLICNTEFDEWLFRHVPPDLVHWMDEELCAPSVGSTAALGSRRRTVFLQVLLELLRHADLALHPATGLDRELLLRLYASEGGVDSEGTDGAIGRADGTDGSCTDGTNAHSTDGFSDRRSQSHSYSGHSERSGSTAASGATEPCCTWLAWRRTVMHSQAFSHFASRRTDPRFVREFALWRFVQALDRDALGELLAPLHSASLSWTSPLESLVSRAASLTAHFHINRATVAFTGHSTSDHVGDHSARKRTDPRGTSADSFPLLSADRFLREVRGMAPSVCPRGRAQYVADVADALARRLREAIPTTRPALATALPVEYDGSAEHVYTQFGQNRARFVKIAAALASGVRQGASGDGWRTALRVCTLCFELYSVSARQRRTRASALQSALDVACLLEMTAHVARAASSTHQLRMALPSLRSALSRSLALLHLDVVDAEQDELDALVSLVDDTCLRLGVAPGSRVLGAFLRRSLTRSLCAHEYALETEHLSVKAPPALSDRNQDGALQRDCRRELQRLRRNESPRAYEDVACDRCVRADNAERDTGGCDCWPVSLATSANCRRCFVSLSGAEILSAFSLTRALGSGTSQCAFCGDLIRPSLRVSFAWGDTEVPLLSPDVLLQRVRALIAQCRSGGLSVNRSERAVLTDLRTRPPLLWNVLFFLALFRLPVSFLRGGYGEFDDEQDEWRVEARAHRPFRVSRVRAEAKSTTTAQSRAARKARNVDLGETLKNALFSALNADSEIEQDSLYRHMFILYEGLTDEPDTLEFHALFKETLAAAAASNLLRELKAKDVGPGRALARRANSLLRVVKLFERYSRPLLPETRQLRAHVVDDLAHARERADHVPNLRMCIRKWPKRVQALCSRSMRPAVEFVCRVNDVLDRFDSNDDDKPKYDRSERSQIENGEDESERKSESSERDEVLLHEAKLLYRDFVANGSVWPLSSVDVLLSFTCTSFWAGSLALS
ncbi:MAG: hypothetical protein MHM6MM_000254 [Cercozoa sp. M6MM]